MTRARTPGSLSTSTAMVCRSISVTRASDEHHAFFGDRSLRLALGPYQHRGFARDVDDDRIGMGDLDAHCRRQTISHRAQTARGHPAVRLFKFEELRGPHLVLADFRGDVDITVPGQRIKPLDRILRLDQ